MGGEGSGRLPNPETIAKRMSGPVNYGNQVTQYMPSLGGVQPEAKRSSSVPMGKQTQADSAYFPEVVYGTDVTPPTASNFPIGTIYIQYTA